MHIKDKIDQLRDDMRQLVKVLLDVGSDEGAQTAASVNVMLRDVASQVAEDGVSECNWAPLPRDNQGEPVP
jgi:hypothetical protein